jgi:hypothetical protein
MVASAPAETLVHCCGISNCLFASQFSLLALPFRSRPRVSESIDHDSDEERSEWCDVYDGGQNRQNCREK